MEWAIFGAILATLVAGIWIFNRLVEDRNRVLAAWSDIGVQLKRRHDLIPKLVEAVKAYASYEQATMSRVTELRAAAERVSRPAETSRIEREITGAMHRLMAVAESYPDLKASDSFLNLMQQVSEAEKHIQHARRYYNGAVKQFNVRIESFPSNLVAGLFRFRQADYFDWEGA